MTDREVRVELAGTSLTGWWRIPEQPHALLLLAHGAGAGAQHQHMNALSAAFADVGIATFRFNFPFIERGARRVDAQAVSVQCIIDASDYCQAESHLPLFVGGHSYGGRMATHAVLQSSDKIEGLILCSFPLHAAKKPGVKRAQHLPEVTQPMLFLSGSRDALADAELMEALAAKLPQAQLHWLDTADHSFKVLKRARQSDEDVYVEAARVAAEFIASLHG